MLDWLDGAENCLTFGNVQAGEQVLLLAEPGVDMRGLELLSLCARQRGAHPTVLVRERSGLAQPVSPVVAAALQAADMVYDFGYPIVHTREGWLANVDYGTKILIVRPDAAIFGSPAARFPLDVWYTIGAASQRRIRQAGAVRVTDAKGTDFTVRMPPGTVGPYIGPKPYEPGPAVPGYLGTWPPGTTVWGDIDYTTDGTICPDAVYTFSRLEPPMTWTIEGGYVTEIKGGLPARTLQELIRGVQNGNRVGEMGFGMNPKVSLVLDASTPTERAARVLAASRRAGTFFLAMGGNIIVGGRDYSPQPPIYALLTRPTVFAGDEPIIEDGHLRVLEDTAVREVAAGTGDADAVLSYLAE